MFSIFYSQGSFPQVQLANANGQPQLVPILTSNGYHHQAALNGHHRHHHQSLSQQYQPAYLADPNSLLHHTMSPGAASANALLPPQQRTDRLQVFENANLKCNFSYLSRTDLFDKNLQILSTNVSSLFKTKKV
jgi:hypothetical protein